MKTYKLGLDIGNSGIKMVGKINKSDIFDQVKALVSHDSTDNANVVLLDGESSPVHFGVGDALVLHDKTTNPYLEHIILLAIVNVYGHLTDCEHVKVAIGLPLKRYKSDVSQFEKELEEIKQVSGYVNNKYYVFSISIEVKAEGYSAFYYLMPNLDKALTWLIPDHGYGTTDIVAVSYDSSKKRWKIDDYHSIDKGLKDMYSAIAIHFAEQVSRTITDKKPDLLPPERIEYYIQEKTKIGVINAETNEREYLYYNDYTEGANKVIETIYHNIGAKFKDSSMREILLIGGGAELVYKHLKLTNKLLQGTTEQRIYANAIGYYLQLKD